MELLQKHDLDPASFANASTVAAGGVVIRTDPTSVVGAFVATAVATGARPTGMTHAYTGADGAGTLTLTWADGGTLTCALGPLPTPCP